MKSKRVLKIILLVFSMLLTGFISFMMYIVVIQENAPFEYSMLIPITMIVTGGLGVAYHLKTLKFYSLKAALLIFKDPVLWIGNVLFAISQILVALYLANIFYLDYGTNRNEVVYYVSFIIIIIMFVLGICLILETHNLYKRISKSDSDLFKGSIDDIGGGKVEG